MTRPIQNDESLSIELEEEDLLDIDGSDDPTMAFGGKALLSKMRAPRRAKKRAQVTHVIDDPTVIVRDRDPDIRETIPFPKRIVTKSPWSPPAAHAPVPASMTPKKSPTISPAPPVRSRDANSSYPPIAINVGSYREPQMSLISERPARAGWIAAAVLGVLILVGGSLKVGAPKVVQAAAQPTPVAAAEQPAPAPETTPEEAKVVTFGDSQGVAIKSKADAKSDAKADAKVDAKADPKKPAPHAAFAGKPAAKPVASSKVDNSLAVTKEEPKKEEKAPAASHDVSKAEQKKLQDLADLQLKAASR